MCVGMVAEGNCLFPSQLAALLCMMRLITFFVCFFRRQILRRRWWWEKRKRGWVYCECIWTTSCCVGCGCELSDMDGVWI